jgi:diguanylate cyclase (GGDEF)-like protein
MSDNHLRRRHALALLLTALAAIAGYALMVCLTLESNADEALRTHLGRTRVYLEEAARHAQTHLDTTDTVSAEEAFPDFRHAVFTAEAEHDFTVALADESLQQRTGVLLTQLDMQMDAYLEDVDALLAKGIALSPEHPEVRELLLRELSELTEMVDRVIAAHQAERDRLTRELLLWELVPVLLILLILLLEYLFIFRPMAQTITKDRAALEALNRELERLASTDTLTGAFNRRKFQEIAARACAAARRDGTPLSLVLMDIDHFKQFNDLHGHETGDAVLREVAQVLRENVRENDYLVRWGGEEFLVFAPGSGAQAGQALAEKLRTRIAAHKVSGVHEVTISAGAVTVDGNTAMDAAIRRADEALYRAKANGRNQVCVATA